MLHYYYTETWVAELRVRKAEERMMTRKKGGRHRATSEVNVRRAEVSCPRPTLTLIQTTLHFFLLLPVQQNNQLWLKTSTHFQPEYETDTEMLIFIQISVFTHLQRPT